MSRYSVFFPVRCSTFTGIPGLSYLTDLPFVDQYSLTTDSLGDHQLFIGTSVLRSSWQLGSRTEVGSIRVKR